MTSFFLEENVGGIFSSGRIPLTFVLCVISVVINATGDQRIREFMIQGRRAFPRRISDNDPIGFFARSAGTRDICSTFTGVGFQCVCCSPLEKYGCVKLHHVLLFHKLPLTFRAFSFFVQNVLIDEEQLGESREPWSHLKLYWNPPNRYQGHMEFRYVHTI